MPQGAQLHKFYRRIYIIVQLSNKNEQLQWSVNLFTCISDFQQ